MTATLGRRDVHPEPLVDGRPVPLHLLGRARRRAQRLFVSHSEREEAEVERRLRAHAGVTRANTVAVISPKGGVGKTTATFLIGNLLASHLKLRVIAVDANPEFGTLARLAPEGRRAPRSLAHVLRDADRLLTAAQLTPYVSRLPSGLHILGAPHDAALPARTRTNGYGELVAFLSTFYDVVLLDLGTGIVGPLARFATERADRVVLLTTPDWIAATVVLDALGHVRDDHATVAINKALGRPAAVEERFRAAQLHRAVAIPYDDGLATMLDSGTYGVEALRAETRVAVKRLGLVVAEQLV